MAQDAYVTPTIQASTTTWAQYKTGGLKIVLDKLITANAAKADPVVGDRATVAISTATGTLPAGAYFAAFTYVDAFGETAIGASESTTFSVAGLTELATVTLPAKPTGVQSMNLYLTATGGLTGTETLYATGITGTTFACNVTFPAKNLDGAGLPANTTGAEKHTQRIYSLIAQGPSEVTLYRLSEELSNYLSGMPIPRREIVRQHLAWAGITKLWYTALNEIGTLVGANMPTAATTTILGTGMPQSRWTLA